MQRDKNGQEPGTIVLFAASGGSGMDRGAQDFAFCCPDAAILDGMLFGGNPSVDALRQWANRF